MKLVAIALVLFFGAVLSGAEFVAQAQTDWYSRGIVRQQTIKVGIARQKRKQYLKRKKRKPTVRHPTSTKPKS